MTRSSQVKITVLKVFSPSEVFQESPVIHEEPFGKCPFFKKGDEFTIDNYPFGMPEGFCPAAWQSIYHSIRTLAFGGNFPWLKEKGVGVACCIDGLRPVVFKFERV